MNMGFLIAETPGAVINKDLTGSQQWTSDHSILVLRHTNNDDSVWYEGDWKDGTESIVAIRHMVGDVTYYGWLKLQFNKDTEYITLTEYAYNLDSGKSIKVGEKD